MVWSRCEAHRADHDPPAVVGHAAQHHEHHTPCAQFKDRLVLLILTWMVCKCFHSYYITWLVSNNIIKMVYYSHVVVAHKRIFKYLVAVCAKMQFVDGWCYCCCGSYIFLFIDLDDRDSSRYLLPIHAARFGCWTPNIYERLDGGRRAMLDCVRYCIWSFINIHWNDRPVFRLAFEKPLAFWKLQIFDREVLTSPLNELMR